MGDKKNYFSKEAVGKLQEMADSIRVCMFCTLSETQLVETRPMATQQVDDQGNFWFFSVRSSDKNLEIRNDDHVQLIYGNPSDARFLSVFGTAAISEDRAKIKEMWNDLAKAWFPKGVDDPELTLLCVKPSEAYYWDTKHGKMVSLIKIAASAISGAQMDDGIEGRIKL